MPIACATDPSKLLVMIEISPAKRLCQARTRSAISENLPHWSRRRSIDRNTNYCLPCVSEMIQSCSGPTIGRRFLSDRSRARAGARVVERFTERRTKDNRRRHHDCAISLPLGIPLVDHLGSGIWEIRSRLTNRIGRTLFFVHEGEIILLHSFIKKTRKTPNEDRALALRRKNAYLKNA
jgi:phage-related protein